MRALCFVFFCLLINLSVNAHPAIGLVYDGKNTIYYSDLNHIWKLDTNTGLAEIYKENIHSHQLFLDRQGNLYGEHYWYLESEGKFRNYIWRINKDGTFQKIRNDLNGENTDFSFVRDTGFNGYTINKSSDRFQIVKSDSLSSEVWHTLPLRQPNWQYLTKQGSLLFVDFPSIYIASKTEVSVLVKDISARRFPFNLQDDKHNIYGLWTDNENLVYAAVYGGRQLKRIDKEGKTTRVLTSDFLWSPVNGVFDKNNDLWLMECRIGGSVRVRKIENSELADKASFVLENCLIVGLGLVIILFLMKRLISKRKNV